MKKAVLAVVLATASTLSVSHYAVAQAPAAPASGEITLPPAESNAYNAAIAQTTPAAKASALEAFLTQYPNTQVKNYALAALLQAYTQADPTKILPTADRVLQADPTNVPALTMETYLRKQAADAATDATQKQAGYDEAAGYAQKGLAAIATKPKDMSDADYTALKNQALPLFYDAVGMDAFNKGDAATAIDTFKKELTAVPAEMTSTPGSVLFDEYLLGQAYSQLKPQDLVSCAFYTARASGFAPEPIKSQMLKTAQYCYNKYHGKMDGFEAVQAAAAANLNPPADFKIVPAPSPKDLAKQALEGTDPATLALADREFILANGAPEDADKVWQTMKGKAFTIPDALVIAATPTQLQVAVSDDAQQTKTADVTVQIKPIEAPATPKVPTATSKKAKADYDALVAETAVGAKVTFSGTYDSYTATPALMITMSDGEVQLPKAAKAAPAARTAPAARRAPAKK